MSALSQSYLEEIIRIERRGSVKVQQFNGKWHNDYNKGLVKKTINRLNEQIDKINAKAEGGET